MKLPTAITKTAEFLLGFVYPKRCVLCNAFTNNNACFLCSLCTEQLEIIRYPVCPVCGASVSKDGKCSSCRGKLEYLERNISFLVYDDVTKDLIKRFKYDRLYNIGRDIVRLMLSQEDAENRLEFFSEIDLFVPIPLHESKLRSRGFNQAEIISKALSAGLKIPENADIIRRVRETTPQSLVPATARKSNVSGSFGIAKNVPEDVNKICIIDDIYTSGNTINECAKVLLENGAKSVCSFTIARAL